MKFIIFDPDNKYFNNKSIANIFFFKETEYLTFKPSLIQAYDVFYSISIVEHYYLDMFIDSYNNRYSIFESFFSLMSSSKKDGDYFNALLENNIAKYSSTELLSFSFFLAAFGYSVTAGKIYKYLLSISKNEKIERIARKFMYDFSDNNELLSEYYIEKKSYLIKQGNMFYDQHEFYQASIYFDKIVNYHKDKNYINKFSLALAKSSQFQKAENIFKNLNVNNASISELSINGYVALLQMRYSEALDFYSTAINIHPVNKISKKKLFIKIIRELISTSSKGKLGKRIASLIINSGLTVSSLKEFVNLIMVRSETYYSIGNYKKSLKDSLLISKWFRPDFFRSYENIYLINKSVYNKSKRRLKYYICWLTKIVNYFEKKNDLVIVASIKKYLVSLKITLGRLHLLEVNLPAARDVFFKAYNINSEARALEWLAYSYFCLTNYNLSLLMYQSVLQKKPNRVPVILQIIRLYTELGQLAKAHEWVVNYHDLLNSQKHKNASHLVRRNLYYLLFDFEKAWLIFRDRNICTQLSLDKSINYFPNIYSLDENTRKESSVLVLAEWGPGDELRWASSYKELERDFGRLTIGCDPRLESLFKRSFPMVNFLPINKKIRGKVTQDNYKVLDKVSHGILTQVFDNYSYHYAQNQDFTALISDVLGECRIKKEAFPIHRGMLVLDRDISTQMYKWLTSLPKKKLNIGVCWKSGLIDATRSIHYAEIDLWKEIFIMKDINFINLQYANYEEDINNIKKELNVDIYNPEIDLRDDFESTAALIKHLDLVISPATAVAELSGMVGTETVLFTNSIEVDWRVLPDNSDLWHSCIKHVRADRNKVSSEAQQSIVNKIVVEIENRISLFKRRTVSEE